MQEACPHSCPTAPCTLQGSSSPACRGVSAEASGSVAMLSQMPSRGGAVAPQGAMEQFCCSSLAGGGGLFAQAVPRDQAFPIRGVRERLGCRGQRGDTLRQEPSVLDAERWTLYAPNGFSASYIYSCAATRPLPIAVPSTGAPGCLCVLPL